jgi:PTS system cellobiose-specific IIB component
MGASTAVLCEKIKEAAKEEGEDINIWATALSVAGDEIPKADVILLGPQIRYMLKKVQKEAEDKPVRAIDMMTYGNLDGKGVYDVIKEMRTDEK